MIGECETCNYQDYDRDRQEIVCANQESEMFLKHVRDCDTCEEYESCWEV